jgi:hypothetical protein
MKCSIAMLMDKRNTQSPKPKDYSGLEFYEKDQSEGKHLNFAKITIIKVWIQQ